MKKEIVFEGRTFSSRAALARELGVTYARVDNAIRRGVPLSREAFLRQRKPPEEIKYGGQVFKNSGHLAKFLGIPSHVLRSRITMKWPEDRWGDPLFEGIKVSYEGKAYKSISDLAEYLGVGLSSLATKIKKGLPESEWLPKCVEITYRGQVFSNQKELARFLGVSHVSLNKRIKKGLPEDQWVSGAMRRKAGYSFMELPESAREMAVSLALSLGVQPEEAYAQIVERLLA